MANPAEVWKAQKHGFDVWPEVVQHAAAGTPMKDIPTPDLERMKWYGFFYRRRDEPGRYMNRIRITAGELSSVQAREVAAIAYEYGHGIVDVTTARQPPGAGDSTSATCRRWPTGSPPSG